MSLIQIDLVGWLPDSLKQQIIDSVVTFVAEQAEKAGRDDVSQALKRLRSDAAFQDAVDRGLKEATDRFVREYMVEDEDLVAVIARDPDFWKAESVRQALLEIVRHPGVYLTEERMTLVRGFADVLRQRVNRERVDRAVTFYLRCVAESLWHLEPLRPMYELQMQRLSVERATEMVQELRGMRADVRGAMVALVQAIGEQQKLLAASDRSALPGPKVYHNLPQPDYGTFIGREAELAQVHRILRPYPHSREHLVTIDGIGGIGKSALALEVAHRYLRDYDRLPPEERFEAIIWTSAKSSVLTAEGIAPRRQVTRTLDDIYTTIAVTLEREDITRARSEEQSELVTKALTRQRTLLIVDNLETVDDERVNAFLRELPAPTKAIVTTRHRIDVAYPVRLTGMPKVDGLALIAQECAKKGVTLTDGEAEKLYNRTGGVPLAIVWSVAQMGYGYSVEAVLRRLGQPSEDIARYCFEGTMERIRGTDAHRLLIALSLFANDASREALGYVAGLGEDMSSRDEGLVTLERLSLVNKQEGRYWMLPLTTNFAMEEIHIETNFRDKALKAYVDFFANLVRKKLGTTYWSVLENWEYYYTSLAIEIDNIMASAKLASAEKMWREVRDIGMGTVHLLWRLGFWEQRIQLMDAAIKAVKELNLREDEAWFRVDGLGWVYWKRGEFDKASVQIRIGRSIAEKLENINIIAMADLIAANITRDRGDYSTAEKNMLEILNFPCESRIRGYILEGLSAVKEFQEDHDAAKRYIEERLKISREIGDYREISIGLTRLGRIYFKSGDSDLAQTYLEKALESEEKARDVSVHAEAKYHLGLIELEKNNQQIARQYLESSLETFRRLGIQAQVAEAERKLETLQAE